MQPNDWEPTAEGFLRWYFNSRELARAAAVKSCCFYAGSSHPVAIYRSRMLIIAIKELSNQPIPPSAGLVSEGV